MVSNWSIIINMYTVYFPLLSMYLKIIIISPPPSKKKRVDQVQGMSPKQQPLPTSEGSIKQALAKSCNLGWISSLVSHVERHFGNPYIWTRWWIYQGVIVGCSWWSSKSLEVTVGILSVILHPRCWSCMQVNLSFLWIDLGVPTQSLASQLQDKPRLFQMNGCISWEGFSSILTNKYLYNYLEPK